ncbi:MAG: transaldolase [Oligoflexia bacterium]|nr:transaldolase [Oligoflexia bacterium]
MPKNKNLEALRTLGQSIWYDNLSRDVLKSGELASIIDAGVLGLTSNPTIFKNAIAGSDNYDDDMKPLARKGMSAADIGEDLMISDVGAAADLLLPVFTSSKGVDGYASIEVSPFLARNTKGTIEAARRLWSRLNRPNIMIKIPATTESLPAIRAALEEGINVNVTLIFSVSVYEQVVEQYMTALETRLAKGQDISAISSVASFFVSRVDTICEKAYDALVQAGKAKAEDKTKFRAKIGVANSKLAYERFEQLFSSARFSKLAKAKALPQRPLWASTGTKSPDLKPVLYVEELAGKQTVNTVPPQTLKALMQGLTVEPRLHQGLPEAKALVKHLGELGLNFNQLMLTLQEEGVKLFADAFQELLDSIEKKRQSFIK